jgi:DNA modification methylase
MITWKIETRKLTSLRDHPKNPRTLSKEQNQKLTESIKRFGVAEKPIINTDGMIIGGHQRLKVLKSMGIKEIECWTPSQPLTEAQADELNIRLNKNTGDWDWECLANEWNIDDLLEWGFNPEEFDIDLSGNEPTEDDAEIEVPAEESAVTKEGDLYILGDHRLFCGSSTEAKNYELLTQGEKANLIITDPPYNLEYVGKTKKALTIQNDSMADGSFYQFLFDAYKNMFDNIEEGASIYVFHADSEGLNFRKAFKDVGFKISECLIWKKNGMVIGCNDYHWQHEPILYGWREGKAHNWYSDRKQTTILEFDKPLRSEEHPTMKPIPIIGYLMKNSSKENDIVLDPFLGSGTTLIAAEQLNRKCYGFELSPSYCDVIVNRWVSHRNKTGMPCIFSRNGVELDQLEPIKE